jgi:hypothetical protein
LEIPTLGRKIFRRNHLRFPPISGIIANILADAVQFVGVADDVFVIIALPNILDVGILTHPFGYPDFKPANDGTNGLGWRTERRGI